MKKYLVFLMLVVFGTSAYCGSSKSFATSEKKSSTSKKHVRTVKKVESKKLKSKKIKLKKKKKHVVLKAFSDSFPFLDSDQRYQDVTQNRLCIYEYIQDLNPSLSTPDAFLIASELATQGQIQKVDPRFVAAIMSVESRFNPRASHNGARGLGQLMGSTARVLGVVDPYSITQNVTATTRYVKQNLSLFPESSFQGQLALASYLLGPRGVREGKGFPARVHQYVANVERHYKALLDLSSLRF